MSSDDLKTYTDPVPIAREVQDEIDLFKIVRYYLGGTRSDGKPCVRGCTHRGSAMVHDTETHTFSCGECGAPIESYAVALRLIDRISSIECELERVMRIYDTDYQFKVRIHDNARQKKCKHTLKRQLPGSGYMFCPSCSLTFNPEETV